MPVLLSVPHAGRAYSEELLASARVPFHTLELLEDRLVDRLIWRAVADGATALVALRPRAEIDLNRDEREIDPATISPAPTSRGLLQSPRSRGGLGLIPSRITGAGAIWWRRLSVGELNRRIRMCTAPITEPCTGCSKKRARASGRQSCSIAIQCHRAPPACPIRPGIVLGDRFGTSIAPRYLDVATQAARRLGFKVARNEPYAGGYITQAHGRPAEGIHALQLEIDRSLYLDEGLRAPGPGFDMIAALIAAIASALAAAVLAPPEALAAE
jgi:N-formylglutamate amidohydrolase